MDIIGIIYIYINIYNTYIYKHINIYIGNIYIYLIKNNEIQ